MLTLRLCFGYYLLREVICYQCSNKVSLIEAYFVFYLDKITRYFNKRLLTFTVTLFNTNLADNHYHLDLVVIVSLLCSKRDPLGLIMFVCICHAITEKNIADAVDQGAGTIQELRDQLNVGTQCGKCVQYAKSVIADKTFNYDLAVEAA